MKVLVDTDILSEMQRAKNERVCSRAAARASDDAADGDGGHDDA